MLCAALSPAAAPVFIVLPHGLDALLEEAVVAARYESGGELNVIVESPKVLDGTEGDDRPLVLFPGAGAVVLEEPQRPRVLHIDRIFNTSSLMDRCTG